MAAPASSRRAIHPLAAFPEAMRANVMVLYVYSRMPWQWVKRAGEFAWPETTARCIARKLGEEHGVYAMAMFALAAARWSEGADKPSDECTARLAEALALLDEARAPSEETLRELERYYAPMPVTAPLEQRPGGYPSAT